MGTSFQGLIKEDMQKRAQSSMARMTSEEWQRRIDPRPPVNTKKCPIALSDNYTIQKYNLHCLKLPHSDLP